MPTGNPLIQQRLDDLIGEGERQWEEFTAAGKGVIQNPIRLTQWITSCLNLLDKLSVSSNRFVKEFERWVTPSGSRDLNIGAALGVLKSARVEYSLGLAVEYHLSVSAAVFDGILDEAEYLLTKGYQRAAAVLLGAALEESLKTRARALGLEVGPKDTLGPIIAKLKAPDVQVLNEFEAKRLESLARMRNDAAHGGEFNYPSDQVSQALSEVRATLEQLLKRR
ncbi:MAG: hypothetical protein ACLQDV_27725 [Candidatus Binataceae bacterium]